MNQHYPITLRTDLPIGRCVEELRRAIGVAWSGEPVSPVASWSSIAKLGWGAGTGVLGDMDGRSFRLYRLGPFRNDATPIPAFFGTLAEDQKGTKITGHFDLLPKAKTLRAATLIVLPLAGIVILRSVVAAFQAGQRSMQDALASIFAISVASIFVVIIYGYSHRVYAGDQALILNFLKNALSARVETDSQA